MLRANDLRFFASLRTTKGLVAI
jgi:hypothetical protein